MSGELVDLVLSEADEKMAKTVARTRHEFSTIRTGRPSPALVERIPIDYFGSEVPLQQLASFSVSSSTHFACHSGTSSINETPLPLIV